MSTSSSLKAKVAVWGWWQGRNLGDMWILYCIKKRFGNIFNIIPINTSVEEYSSYDFLIIGGGGLFNGPLLRSPFDKPLNVKYGAFGLGGEFFIQDKVALRKFINLSKFFGVRDTRNMDTYAINDNRRMEISGDCSFLYPLKRIKTLTYPKNINIMMIWRNPYGLMKWHTSKHHSVDGQNLNALFKEYLGPIPFNNNNKCKSLYTKICKVHGKVIQEDYTLHKQFTPNVVTNKFKHIHIIVTMRYHGVIAAIQLGIPVIALDIYPKVRTVMTSCGLEEYCIKLHEFDKVKYLMAKIKRDTSLIRLKMSVYSQNEYSRVNAFSNSMEKKIKYVLSH